MSQVVEGAWICQEVMGGSGVHVLSKSFTKLLNMYVLQDQETPSAWITLNFNLIIHLQSSFFEEQASLCSTFEFLCNSQDIDSYIEQLKESGYDTVLRVSKNSLSIAADTMIKTAATVIIFFCFCFATVSRSKKCVFCSQDGL